MDTGETKLILLVAVGGAVGSVLRYLVQAYLTRGDFPWGTFAVNIIGSFLITLIFFYMSSGTDITSEFRAFIFVGILGGFTTMSSFSLETVGLLIEGQWWWAFGNIALNSGVCIVGALLGRTAGLLLGGY